MRTLTGMGGLGNAQDLAELLRQMGRGPDTMLAHITPEEAQMLLESGGSGKINPMTGLPEFQPVYDDYTGQFYDDSGTAMQDFAPAPEFDIGFGPGQFAPPTQPADIRGMESDQFERFTGQQPMFTGQGSLAPQDFQPFQYGPANMAASFQPGQVSEFYSPAATRMPPAAVQRPDISTRGGVTPPGADQQQQQQQQSFRREYPMLSRLLTTGLASLPAAYFAGRARREGRGAESELRAMAAPIREQAEALRQQALSGGLTPQQARQQEARRASLRQSATQRGGTTGTQQAMIENTLSRERAGLAQTNLENAMRQLNLANTVTESAIRARLASDREVDRYLSNIYTNLIRTTSGGQGNFQQPQGMEGNEILPERRLFEEPSAKR